jgi:hypothetical protein
MTYTIARAISGAETKPGESYYTFKDLKAAYAAGVAAEREVTTDDAYAMGAKGAQPTEAERLLFEAWMRGHCWAVIGEWNGNQYVHAHEKTGFVHGGAVDTRRLWAAWRDRAALAIRSRGEDMSDLSALRGIQGVGL